MLFSPKSLIVTNYSDIAKFDNLISLCAMYEVNRLDLNEMYNEDTLEAYFSVPEDYHTGEQKRTLFVFTNPTLDFLRIITGHTEIKYLVVLNSDKSISESDVVKNARNVLLYSSKTGVFIPEIEVGEYELKLIEEIQKDTNFDNIHSLIEKLTHVAKDIYLNFVSGKNNQIRESIGKLSASNRKILLPKMEQYIMAYYGIDIVIAGNGARMRNPGDGEKALEIIADERNLPKPQGPRNEVMLTSKKKSSKKSSSKNDAESLETAIEYDDSLEPILEEQQKDLNNLIREVAHQDKTSLIRTLHPPPSIQHNDNQGNEATTFDGRFNGLHPPAGAKIITDLSKSYSKPDSKSINKPNINPDHKFSVWKGEFDALSGLDKLVFRVFCQVLSEYRACVEKPAYCEEVVTPEQIYIELRAGNWSAGVPSEFTSKWLYLHTLNQLKSKPQSVDTEFEDISKQMNSITAKLGFIEKPDCETVLAKVKTRIAKGFAPRKDPIPEVLKHPIVVEQPFPKPIVSNNEEVVPPFAEGIVQLPSSKNQKEKARPNQEVVEAIRHVKLVMKSGDIEDFAAYGRALQKMLEFIGRK